MKRTQKYRKIVERYIQSYNNFDIAGMLKDLDENVRFKNISNGKIDMDIEGIEAFKKQAEHAINLFQDRNQTITNIKSEENTVGVEITYSATLDQDLPNGLKAGDTIELEGRSTFVFEDDKIISITDES